MPENEYANIHSRDIAESFGLLTRLPVTATGERGIRAAWAWPLVGGIVGLIAGMLGMVALWFGLPAGVGAGIALVTQVMLTGAMHEDGLADCADGFWGGATPERRLQIMKDSAIGTYGSLALILSTLIHWSLMSALFAAGFVLTPLIVAGALSRLPMVALMRYLTQARNGGLSANTGIPSHDTLLLSTATALLIAIVFAGFSALPAAIVAGMATWITARLAVAKIGGQTGDVLGASQQLAEIGALMALTATLT